MTLSSFELLLRPVAVADLKGHIGRLTNGLVYALLREGNPVVADEEHILVGADTMRVSETGAGVRTEKPKHINGFTVSSLQGNLARVGNQLRVSPASDYILRLTTLRTPVYEALGTALIARMAQGGTIEIGDSRFIITRLHTDLTGHSEWVARSTYEDLWEKVEPATSLTLHFASPTAFRMGEIDMLFPVPFSVYRSLWEKWNRFAPQLYQLDNALFTEIEHSVAVSRYTLATRMVDGDRVKLKGFTGTVTYEFKKASRESARILTMLAHYALFAGVGKKTTQGMGQVRFVT